MAANRFCDNVCLRGRWFLPCACDGGHHAGFGPVGDHSHDVEEEFFAFGQCIQEVLFADSDCRNPDRREPD